MAKANPKFAEYLAGVVSSLPRKPGVYQYFDENGKILYVGKAKSLKSRVSSYFNRDTQHGAKITMLVKRIADIKVLVVESEWDALLLENNLIKKHQPRYNILLKDDKTYPWIVIKKEPFPRVFSTRYVTRDGSQYFGPYPSGTMMHTILDLIRQLYPLRTCKLNLSQNVIDSGKHKVCLEYHIGNCKAPCIGEQKPEEYKVYTDQIKHILKGNIGQVNAFLKKQMMMHAEQMEFEQAQKIKEKLLILERYQSKSSVVSASIHNVDVFSFIEDNDEAFVNYLKVMGGAVVQAHSVVLKKRMNEPKEDLLLHAILDMRNKMHSESNEIILPFELDVQIPNIKVLVPQRGEKKKLLELSQRNAKFFRLDLKKKESLVDPERHSKRILATMKKDLRMSVEPSHIECFDNSNIQGTHAVAACVVFKNAKPSKRDYRHFNIKTVEGPDDYGSMKEIVSRRYSRLLEEESPIPQLIVVDGGKGQLNAAVEALEELGLRKEITIVGIAKRLEELFFPGDKYALHLDKTSETLKIIQHARDEAHRFGITHYRKKHQKTMKKTELEDIPGIGPAISTQLLKHFKSVAKLKESNKQEVIDLIGKAKAKLVLDYFKMS